jgi:hypothetical protein
MISTGGGHHLPVGKTTESPAFAIDYFSARNNAFV